MLRNLLRSPRGDLRGRSAPSVAHLLPARAQRDPPANGRSLRKLPLPLLRYEMRLPMPDPTDGPPPLQTMPAPPIPLRGPTALVRARRSAASTANTLTPPNSAISSLLRQRPLGAARNTPPGDRVRPPARTVRPTTASFCHRRRRQPRARTPHEARRTGGGKASLPCLPHLLPGNPRRTIRT
jgi:hypothetical protein